MARLKGILKLEGALGGLSFYSLNGEIVVRKGWGPDTQRMRKDPAFERARENGKEFGACAKAGKVLRLALHDFLVQCPDKEMTPRVNKLMFQLKNLDEMSKRGERHAAKGLETAAGAQLLKAFAFNAGAPLGKALKTAVKTDHKKGTILLPDLLPKRDLVFPKGATHAELQAGIVKLDLSAGTFAAETAPLLSLSKKDAARDLVLTLGALPKGTGLSLCVLSIRFLQKLNGRLYPLKDARFNSCGVSDVQP